MSEITHKEKRVFGVSLYTQGICQECGKITYLKVNDAYGKRAQDTYGNLPDVPQEQECKCEHDEDD
jgi:hypothetical protein